MKKLGIFLLMVSIVQFGCAAHWISGFNEDALDGEGVDGKDVFMWNPLIGAGDNVSGAIGPGGMSGVSGVYLLDCEMLGAGCLIGDILSLKIFSGQYISWIVNVTISGAGYDVVQNLSLNSPPNVSLVSPTESGLSNSSVNFNCSFFDYDDNIEKVSLWGNWSGSWIEEGFVTSGFEEGFNVFSDVLTEGVYRWNCLIEDELGISSWGVSNNSFFVDTALLSVSDIVSASEVCGFGFIPVDCSVVDDFGVDRVFIQTTSPGGTLTNYSAPHLVGDIYRANVNLDEAGSWGLTCFGYDLVNNSNFSIGDNISVESLNAEIGFIGGVNLDKAAEIEGEVLTMDVNVTNFGCVGSGNFKVGFFDNGINFWNESVIVGVDEYLEVFANWTVDIGSSEFAVYVDLDDVINEDNESNNIVNSSAWLGAWQGIYGNVSLDKILAGGASQMGNWSNEEVLAGNVFIADFEADINWNNLQAIGRDRVGGISSGDFGEIDSLLEMGSFNDSVFEVFDGSEVCNFSVFGKDILNTPFINSSSSGNFVTGILWDMGDSVDLEYDSVEKEDVVFVAKVNRGKVGDHGVYDYEIKVPSKLRGYDSGDETRIYLYYDLA